MDMIIEQVTTMVWGTDGECNKCGYTRLRIEERTTAGTVTISENGVGQFSLIKTYLWVCSGCNASGPACNIDRS